jgi:Kef-type K+ transport system membrane component KefB
MPLDGIDAALSGLTLAGPGDKRALVYTSVSTFGVFAIALTLLRFYIRTWVLRTPWWDDYTALVAAVLLSCLILVLLVTGL